MKKSIFDFTNYKTFVKEWIQTRPDGGRGQLSRIGKLLNISSVSVSHIFNGPRDLSAEQAEELSDFFNFTETETAYFILLVQIERSGTERLRSRYKRDAQKVRDENLRQKVQVRQTKKLDEATKAQFYSNWYYSAVRLTSGIENMDTIEAIAERLNLSRNIVREVVDFLLQHGLCVEENNRIKLAPMSTHLEGNSLLVNRHHANWRLKGIQNMESISKEELFYTGPMVLSVETMAEIRKMLADMVELVIQKVIPSPSEQLACLNIDWFKVER